MVRVEMKSKRVPCSTVLLPTVRYVSFVSLSSMPVTTRFVMLDEPAGMYCVMVQLLMSTVVSFGLFDSM